MCVQCTWQAQRRRPKWPESVRTCQCRVKANTDHTSSAKTRMHADMISLTKQHSRPSQDSWRVSCNEEFCDSILTNLSLMYLGKWTPLHVFRPVLTFSSEKLWCLKWQCHLGGYPLAKACPVRICIFGASTDYWKHPNTHANDNRF